MGKLISEFIDGLATQAGIDTSSDSYISLIQDKRLSEVSFPDEIEKAIYSGILTKESAKNDKDIAGHFKVRYMKSAEVAQKRALKEIGVSDDLISELEKEPDTIKRIEMSYPKIFESFKASNQSTTGAVDDTKYKSLIATHNDTLKRLQEVESTWTEKEKTWKQTMDTREIDWQVNNMINNYSLTDSIPAEDSKFIINKKIKESPFLIKNENGKLNIYQKENPDLIAQEKNKPVTLKDVVDMYVAPYLKKSNPSNTQSQPVRQVVVEDKNISGQKSEAVGKNAESLRRLQGK
jgi:hypothetical protein